MLGACTQSHVPNLSDDLPITVTVINSVLYLVIKGSASPIRFCLQTSLGSMDSVTRRIVKGKAKEYVDVLLESIAPG